MKVSALKYVNCFGQASSELTHVAPAPLREKQAFACEKVCNTAWIDSMDC